MHLPSRSPSSSQAARRLRRTIAVAGVVAVLAIATAVLVPRATDPAAAAGGGMVDELEARFLTTRPPVGETWVANVGSLSTSEKVMLRTLQGIVNRTSARIYLIDPGDSGAHRWLDEYQARGLVTVAGTTDAAGILDRFAGEAAGYVLADAAQDWTINAAATIATDLGAVVATADEEAALQARGLTMLDDVRGRWPDAATAYEALAASHRSRMPYGGIAVLRPTDALYDFTTQQGILTVFSRPNAPDWARVAPIITGSTPGRAVYGYISDTGDEEAVAVAALSAAGLFLIPTDTTRNLSFHIAVGSGLARQAAAQPNVSQVEPCRSDQVNVVVAISDGDNINVPISHYSRSTSWPSPRRGEMPLGWSVSPSLAVLAPTVWDTYVREASANDELVGILGYGYAAASLVPNPVAFYSDSFAAMDELGLSTFWSLGGGLETPSAGGWNHLDTAAGDGFPSGVLVGYGNSTGVGRAFHSPAGRPAFTSGTAYQDAPDQLRGQIQALQAMPDADRPLVVFLSASQWTNPMAGLFDALLPLQAEGVRFLSPSEAVACVPDAEPPVAPERGPGLCLPDDDGTLTGLPLVSDTLAGEVKRQATAFDVPLSVSATPSVDAGGTIAYEIAAAVDLDAMAARIRDERARPLISEGYGEAIGASAWVEMAFTDLTIGIVLPDGVVPAGDPTIPDAASGYQARWSAAAAVPMLELVLDPVAVDTRAPTGSVEVTVVAQAAAASRNEAWTAEVVARPITFDLAVTIGVLVGDVPISGTVTGPWSCGSGPTVLASTLVAASPDGPDPTDPDPTDPDPTDPDPTPPVVSPPSTRPEVHPPTTSTTTTTSSAGPAPTTAPSLTPSPSGPSPSPSTTVAASGPAPSTGAAGSVTPGAVPQARPADARPGRANYSG